MKIKDVISHSFNEDEFNLDDYNLIDIDSVDICANAEEMNFVDINVKDDHTVFANIISNGDGSMTDVILEQCDGAHIRALYIAFFSKYAPSIIREKRLCCLQLPLICMKDSKGNIVEMFGTFDEYNEWLKDNKNSKLECKYFKGLGSWKEKEVKALIAKYGISRFIEPLEYDEDSIRLIDEWVGKKNADIRKVYLKENEFSIFGI